MPNQPKGESLWMWDHVQHATWCENGDLAIKLLDRITRQWLLHRLTWAPKGQWVWALKAQLTRAEAEAGDALLQAAANTRIRLVKLGNTVLLLPATKQWTCGVLVLLTAPEAASISGHLAAWVAQHPHTWHTNGMDVLAQTPQQQAISCQEIHVQHQQSDHH